MACIVISLKKHKPPCGACLKRAPVGAAEGCDLLLLPFKNKIKRSQPAAAPTGAALLPAEAADVEAFHRLGQRHVRQQDHRQDTKYSDGSACNLK
jgi:hypothetical protein